MNKIKFNEIKKNNRLTNFEDIKDSVINYSIKETKENKKTKDQSEQELLIYF